MALNNIHIEALGNLLATYHSDLYYIAEFQNHKFNSIGDPDYTDKKPGSFKSFLNEFRVARNIKKDETKTLLNSTRFWIQNNDSVMVDDFAAFLTTQNMTHGKVMTSLASKILFLNDPWRILPMDGLTRNALSVQDNNYKLFKEQLEIFRSRNVEKINESLISVEQHLSIIENDFSGILDKIEMIRENRFVDKLLWTKGRSLKNGFSYNS